MARVFAKGVMEWPKRSLGQPDLTPNEVRNMYQQGYAGCWLDPEAQERLADEVRAAGGYPEGAEASHAFGLTEAGAGQLTLLFPYVNQFYGPKAWPGAAQQRGDCVSHSSMKACFATAICDIISGKPDEVTGLVEGPPDVSEDGIRNGVFSSECNYWWRGYNGDGWDCATAARVNIGKAALMPRKPYPELGIDLTRYSGSLAGKYGAQSPPAPILAEGQKHLIRTVTRLRSKEENRDFLANGYGISTCGSEGFSMTRDANGVCRRSGSWSHAMSLWGCDDRPVFIQKYGDTGFLMPNNWGDCYKGGDLILDTDIHIPPGFKWVLWRDIQNRSFYAMSGANGWPAKTLPPWQFPLG